VLEAADVELALALVADDHGASTEAAALEVGTAAQRAPAGDDVQRRQQLGASAKRL